MAARLTADDFFTGLLAALAYRGRKVISIRNERFDAILADVFADLLSKASDEGLDVRFRIRPHFIHGDSVTVRDAVAAATQADLISLDNPEYQDIRFKIGRDDAEFFLERLPASKDFFLNLADSFLEHYDDVERPNRTAA
jgi:hypothetical protein